MITELLEYLFSPVSKEARSLGYLKSSLQVRARYRRCKSAWAGHLERTRQFILESARQSARKRTAIILGAGMLHDIPIHELALMFEKVVLVDVVHPLSSRFRTWRLTNVRHDPLDVTELRPSLKEWKRGMPLPRSCPRTFLDDETVDFTVSVNLLSQLGWVPGTFLQSSVKEEEVNAFQRHLIEAHLAYLEKIPGRVALITDVLWEMREGSGSAREKWNVLQDVELPEADASWVWQIAPAPEYDRELDVCAQVYAYADWKMKCKNT